MNSLRDLIAQPEGRTFDRKREEVSLDKALRTLVAFANTAGGTLAIGLADDGSPVGVRDVKSQEERYASAIASGIEPPLIPDLKPVECDGVSLLLIRVPRFPGPFYLRAEGPDEGVYVQGGNWSPITPITPTRLPIHSNSVALALTRGRKVRMLS